MHTYLVLVGLAVALASLQLYFESLHADLEAVHRLDRPLGRRRVVEAHKACSKRNEHTDTYTIPVCALNDARTGI